MPITLFLTATIAPPADTPKLARRDPALRLQDYSDALAHYLSLPDALVSRILFVDNSASDLAPLHARAAAIPHAKQLHLLSFDGNSHPPAYGKGYGEFKLLDHGLDHVPNLSPDDVIWKVTGRLRCLNLPAILAAAPPRYDLLADFKRFPRRWMELRLFSFTVRGYHDLLRGRYEELREDLLHAAPEEHLYRAMLARRSTHTIIPRFKVQPLFAGFGGYLNNNLLEGPEARKYRLRATARKLAPWLWI